MLYLIMGYYRQFRQRMLALIRAQYNPDFNSGSSKVWYRLAARPGSLYTRVANNSWIKQYQPASTEALTSLQQKPQPFLR